MKQVRMEQGKSLVEIVLIGGGYIFKESINIVNKLVLTRVDCDIDGDVFYPKIDLNKMEKKFQMSPLSRI